MANCIHPSDKTAWVPAAGADILCMNFQWSPRMQERKGTTWHPVGQDSALSDWCLCTLSDITHGLNTAYTLNSHYCLLKAPISIQWWHSIHKMKWDSGIIFYCLWEDKGLYDVEIQRSTKHKTDIRNWEQGRYTRTGIVLVSSHAPSSSSDTVKTRMKVQADCWIHLLHDLLGLTSCLVCAWSQAMLTRTHPAYVEVPILSYSGWVILESCTSMLLLYWIEMGIA